MTGNTVLLTIAALIPAAVLCVYTFRKDRVEKEPAKLLALLFALGALMVVPAGGIEVVLDSIITNGFSAKAVVTDDALILSRGDFHWYQIISNFIGVALVEEGLKWLVLYFVTRNNKNFNSLFDGLIYSVFVSLGFAAIENIMYVVKNGWATAFARMVMSVPGHFFFAVIMGYYYTMWHTYKLAAESEKKLKAAGLINPADIVRDGYDFSYGRQMALSIVVPVLIHGFYDYCCSMQSILAVFVLLILLAGLYVFCFKRVKKLSNADALDSQTTPYLILKKYPRYAAVVSQNSGSSSVE